MSRMKDILRESGLPRNEAELLLAHVLKKPRTFVIAHEEEEISRKQEISFSKLAERRMADEPVAYLRGKKEFFGRDFLVNPSVLIPRPSTEGLVQHALDLLQSNTSDHLRTIDSGIVSYAEIWVDLPSIFSIVDVGTGSGCIGITMAMELPHLTIICTDISENALRTAQSNAQMYVLDTHRVNFRKGPLLKPLEDMQHPFLLISNPPYIPQDTTLQSEVSSFEPHEALFAGPDGMDVLRPLINQARTHPQCIGFVLECREEQIGIVEESFLAKERV